MIYIARDKDNGLFLYTEKPIKNTKRECFMPGDGNYMNIDSQLFPEVTYKNSPIEVDINVKMPNIKAPTNNKESKTDHFEDSLLYPGQLVLVRNVKNLLLISEKLLKKDKI